VLYHMHLSLSWPQADLLLSMEPNAAAQPRLEAGALAQAGRRRLQPVVRHGVSLLVVSGNLLRARLKFCRVGTQILPHL